MKKTLLAGIATGLLLIGSQMAQATSIELALLLDGSGSIIASDWTLQTSAYKNIFANNFYTKYLNPGDTLYVGAYQFSTNVAAIGSWATINSDADALAYSNTFSSVTQMKQNTAIGDAINTAKTAIVTNAYTGDRKVIDVSTDGYSNTGAAPTTAAQAAYAAGITVNAIGVGSGINTAELADFTSAAHGFYMTAKDFTAFEAELDRKLQTEISGVPEPATMLLFGAGLAGLAAVGRRRRS